MKGVKGHKIIIIISAHKNNDPADSEDRGHCLSMVSCESKRLGAVQADEAKV
jgi:hypothetical protein